MVLCKNCLYSEPDDEENGMYSCFYYQAYVIDDLSDEDCEGFTDVNVDSNDSTD